MLKTGKLSNSLLGQIVMTIYIATKNNNIISLEYITPIAYLT